MCIIVDANAAHKMNSSDEAGSLVLKWLLRGKGKIIVSKELLKELAKAGLSSTLVVLDRAGRLIRADDESCDQKQKELEGSGNLKSNDAHVVALAIVTKCELVFSHDQPLHQDLKNKSIVSHSCGIYQKAIHRGMLGECTC